MSKTKIIISSGDPAGCGPLITLKAIAECRQKNVDFFVVGDKDIFQKIPIFRQLGKGINFIDLNTANISRIKKGVASKLSGQAALSYLDKSLELMRTLSIKRLVTAPLSKEAVRCVDKQFRGHTEYLASHFRIKDYAMMMTAASFKVVLATRHISLREVSVSLRKNDIYQLLCLVHKSLRRQFKLNCPRIALCAVNPHAGVNTFLEREEKILINACRRFKGIVSGPYPADTIFTKQNLKHYDCVICTYHDQAMIPFKLLFFHKGVNLTLGLPIIRTSPAHGVAYDILQQGKKPFHSSMLEAIALALKLSL